MRACSRGHRRLAVSTSWNKWQRAGEAAKALSGHNKHSATHAATVGSSVGVRWLLGLLLSVALGGASRSLDDEAAAWGDNGENLDCKPLLSMPPASVSPSASHGSCPTAAARSTAASVAGGGVGAAGDRGASSGRDAAALVGATWAFMRLAQHTHVARESAREEAVPRPPLLTR